MKIITFFNMKGGCGKTTLVYNLAWMMADMGSQILAVDLDPQVNLTELFLHGDRLRELWPDGEHPDTIHGALNSFIGGADDWGSPHVEQINANLGLVVGDFALSAFESKFSEAWRSGDVSASGTVTAFYHIIRHMAQTTGSEWVLIDTSPALSALNRAALIVSHYVVIPLMVDRFSLQGVRYLGAALQYVRDEWMAMVSQRPDSSMGLLSGGITPLGYVVMQFGGYERQPPIVSRQWTESLPKAYREHILGQAEPIVSLSVQDDPYNLGSLKHYQSLLIMSRQAGKPVFSLKPADGAIGAYAEAVRLARGEFEALAQRVMTLA